MADYDVIVIGAGPAGYVAAIRCAQLGMKTACVDKWLNNKSKPVLGGTCLNVGCIPSKALLASSHHYAFLQKQAGEHGIHCENLRIDIAEMQARKEDIVKALTQGIATLFKKNKITQLTGSARLLADKQVEITAPDKTVQTVSGNVIIIATGSVPVEIPAAKTDGKTIVDSTGALAFTEVPARLGIIGAGAIGLELGSVWSRLGSQVTILEALPELLPAADRKIAAAAARELKRQGLTIQLSVTVTATKVKKQTVTVQYTDKKDEQTLTVDKLVVAVGRKPFLDGLGVEAVGIQVTERGFIAVDAQRQTSVPGIYAIGDVIGGPMLAHKGSEEGVLVAECLAGQKSTFNYHTVPMVVYTSPEIAWVGHTEEQLQAQGINYHVGQFPFLASGRARAQGETAGLVRILADAATDQVLGVHIFGPSASELIAEAVLALEFEGSAEDLARTIHAHPTLSEAVHEAALDVAGRVIHT